MKDLKFIAVKKPNGPRLQGINVEFEGEKLHFKPKAITIVSVHYPDKIMSSPTKFLANFRRDEQAAIFEVYKTCAQVRDAPSISNDQLLLIDDAVKEFFSIVTRERLEAWGRDQAPYATTESIDNIPPMRDDSVTHSCSHAEYIDLCILSTLGKLLIPFQELTDHISEYISNGINDYWGLFTVLNGAGEIESYPAWQLLKVKARFNATKELGDDGVPTGLTAKGIGEEDFIRIILIPKFFRDITRLETEVAKLPTGVNNNLSFKVNKSIVNYIRHDIASPYKFNVSQGSPFTDDEGGNTTKNEFRAGGERTSSIFGIYFKRDYDKIIEVVKHAEEFPSDLKMEPDEVKALAGKYPRGTFMTHAQYSIVGTVFDSVIPIDSEEYASKSSEVVMMAYTSLIAKRLGLPNLEQLMLCSDDSEGQFSESETRNSVITSQMNGKLSDDMIANYPNDCIGNPGLMAIDSYVQEIVRTNFVVAVDLDNLELGSEWCPRLINDVGIKDEIAILALTLLGVR